MRFNAAKNERKAKKSKKLAFWSYYGNILNLYVSFLSTLQILYFINMFKITYISFQFNICDAILYKSFLFFVNPINIIDNDLFFKI